MISMDMIKRRAMANFQGNYWPSVGILLLGWLVAYAIGLIPGAGGILALLIGSVVSVGVACVSMGIYHAAQIDTGQLFAPFNNYGRVLGGMLWMYLWLALWYLIFAVPFYILLFSYRLFSVPSFAGVMIVVFMVLCFGLLTFMIIKACSFFCTPYILGLFKGVPATGALKLSERIMEGHKMDIFVAVLSFIGWFLLSALTVGILWVFYVGPYYCATMAGFFEEFKNDALRRGVITEADLKGGQLYA